MESLQGRNRWRGCNEIAQSEGATGKPFCNCWIHNGFVNIDNEKMSKSKGNFLTLRKACVKAEEVRAYRYLVVGSQYRNPLNFTPQAVKGSQKALKRIDRVRQQLNEITAVEDEDETTTSSPIAKYIVPRELSNFETALLDDLSMPRASASLFALIKIAEKEFKKESDQYDTIGLKAINDALTKMDLVFGIFYDVPLSEDEKNNIEISLIIPVDVISLIHDRQAAKESQNWDLADSIRQQITNLGFAVKDVKGGDPIVTRL